MIRRRSFRRRLAYDADLPASLAEALWRGEADRLLYASVPLQVKDRCIVVRHDGPAGPLLVKRHTWGGFGRTLRLAWRPAAARHCAQIASLFAAYGIPTPRPRAVVEERFGPFGYRSYLLTDFIEGTDLYRYIRFGRPTNDQLRHVARQVARIWLRMLELGISHNDTKPENFIVDKQLRVWLIDFEKVRLRGKPDRQRQRQIADVANFLHVRGWHRRPAARRIFLDEFLRTPFGHWLADSLPQDSSQVDANLAVLILCADHHDASSARWTVDSVWDIADEIVLAAPAAGGRLDELERFNPCGPNNLPPQWLLVLHADEAATPFLAKELQQRIADPRSADAFRIPIDQQYFGRNIPRGTGTDAGPIRLFRRERCSYSLAGGVLAVVADPQGTDSLSGSLEKCVAPSVAAFIDSLNERTTAHARRRFVEADKPRLLAAAMHSMRRFLTSYFWDGRFRSGWTGLQIAFLEAVFAWLEETKLRQMSSEFRTGDEAQRSIQAMPAHSPTVPLARSKAA